LASTGPLEDLGFRALTVPTGIPLVGVGVVITNDDQWLLMRRRASHGEGTWSSPGGHLDFGEHPAECARREAIEETGLTIDQVEFIGATNDVFDSDRHYVTLWFEAKGVNGEAYMAAPEEATEVRWFSRDALPEPLFEPLRRLLDRDIL
jgi:8-oxo-dGTP diphosphatase